MLSNSVEKPVKMVVYRGGSEDGCFSAFGLLNTDDVEIECARLVGNPYVDFVAICTVDTVLKDRRRELR